jgi:hypothetical protein
VKGKKKKKKRKRERGEDKHLVRGGICVTPAQHVAERLEVGGGVLGAHSSVRSVYYCVRVAMRVEHVDRLERSLGNAVAFSTKKKKVSILERRKEEGGGGRRGREEFAQTCIFVVIRNAIALFGKIRCISLERTGRDPDVRISVFQALAHSFQNRHVKISAVVPGLVSLYGTSVSL